MPKIGFLNNFRSLNLEAANPLVTRFKQFFKLHLEFSCYCGILILRMPKLKSSLYIVLNMKQYFINKVLLIHVLDKDQLYDKNKNKLTDSFPWVTTIR